MAKLTPVGDIIDSVLAHVNRVAATGVVDDALKCDCCHKLIDDPREAWLSWWWNFNTKATSRVWITCHPSECLPAQALERAPDGESLMDHYVRVVAGRGIEQWAKEYNIGADGVERVRSFMRARGF